jgi:hypothetical protein
LEECFLVSKNFDIMRKKKIILLSALIFFIILLWIVDFGCKDRSIDESKRFYFENKELLNTLKEGLISQHKLNGVRNINPGLGFFSCNHPIKWLDIIDSLDRYELLVYSIENIKNSESLKIWCIEKEIDFEFLVDICDFVLNNDLFYIGRTNLFENNFEISFSVRTSIINLSDSTKIKIIEGRTKENIEDNWFFINTFK